MCQGVAAVFSDNKKKRNKRKRMKKGGERMCIQNGLPIDLSLAIQTESQKTQEHGED